MPQYEAVTPRQKPVIPWKETLEIEATVFKLPKNVPIGNSTETTYVYKSVWKMTEFIAE